MPLVFELIGFGVSDGWLKNENFGSNVKFSLLDLLVGASVHIFVDFVVGVLQTHALAAFV